MRISLLLRSMTPHRRARSSPDRKPVRLRRIQARAQGSSLARAQSQKEVSCSTFQMTKGLTRFAVSPRGRPECFEFAGFRVTIPSSSAAKKMVFTQLA